MKITPTKKTIAAAGLAGVLLAGAATTVAVAAGNNGEDGDSSITGTVEVPSGSTPLADAATVNEADATKAALAAEPGTVDKIELDDEDGFVVWEIDVRKDDGSKIEMSVDAGDASILEQESDDDDGDRDRDEGDFVGTLEVPADATPLVDLATVSEADASAAATQAAPGSVDLAELVAEDGYVVWEVEVTADDGTQTEVVVDAGDASVLEQDVEDGNDDDGDDD